MCGLGQLPVVPTPLTHTFLGPADASEVNSDNPSVLAGSAGRVQLVPFQCKSSACPSLRPVVPAAHASARPVAVIV